MTTPLTLGGLPVDAWPAITRCLTGASLFQLARVNRWSWQSFSQDAFWRDRLALESDAEPGARGEERTALQMYMRAFSFKFQGLPKGVHGDPNLTRGLCAPVAVFSEATRRDEPFAFDAWFCLRDGDTSSANKSEMYAGGIILGAQSVAYNDTKRPFYHQQCIVVSADRELFCSVVNERPRSHVIASNLELNRWYHLTLTYGDLTQKVYLDGQLVRTTKARLNTEWRYGNHIQVGTGCIAAGDGHFPVPQSCSWFPFNGLIDNFRFWASELTAEDVVALAADKAARVEWRPAYSMKRDLVYFSPQRPGKVGCSRPREQHVEPLYRRKHGSD